MHYFEFAQKDATVYEASATQSANTGLDEILEISKLISEDLERMVKKYPEQYFWFHRKWPKKIYNNS